jgi:hypothetical protein
MLINKIFHKKFFGEGVSLVVAQLLSAAGLLMGVRLLTEVVPPAVYASFHIGQKFAVLPLFSSSATLLRIGSKKQ